MNILILSVFIFLVLSAGMLVTTFILLKPFLARFRKNSVAIHNVVTSIVNLKDVSADRDLVIAAPQGDLNVNSTTYLPVDKEPPLWVNVPVILHSKRVVGRDALVEELAKIVCSGQPLALHGMGGVGKTTLAVLLARHTLVRKQYPDGVLWANLGVAPDIARIQAKWADALDIKLRSFITTAQLEQRIVNALTKRCALIVLDDVWEIEAANALCCGWPKIGHVLTTRRKHIARAFAGPDLAKNVPELDEESAYSLLNKLAPEACKADPLVARHLAQTVGGLPIALELLGNYLGCNRSSYFGYQHRNTLAQVDNPATRLALAGKRLGSEHGGEVRLDAIVGLSLNDLPDSARQACYALGAFAPKPAHFALPAAQAVTQADEAMITTLVDANLVEIDTAEQLSLHKVIADVARSHMGPECDERHDCFYRNSISRSRNDWRHIQSMYEQARYAMERLPEDDERIVQWVYILSPYWSRRGLGIEQVRWGQRALDIAHRQDDIKTEAGLLTSLGGVYATLGDNRQAMACLQQALELRRRLGNRRSEATILTQIGAIMLAQGDTRESLSLFHQSLTLRRQIDDKRGEATNLSNIGEVYLTQANYYQALQFFEQAALLKSQTNDKEGESGALNKSGLVYLALGDKQRALLYFEQALALRREVRDQVGEISVLNDIGSAYCGMRNYRKAREHHDKALMLALMVGHLNSEIVTRRYIVKVSELLRDFDRAVREMETIIALGEAIQHPSLDKDCAALKSLQQRRKFQPILYLRQMLIRNRVASSQLAKVQPLP